MSRSMSTSPAASQPGLIDPLVESLIDYSEYDNMQYQSPSLSPSMTSKSAMVRPSIKTEANTAASLMPTPQPMSGPSHQYDLYKQQTGIVPGALASTLAINENNSEITGYNNFTIDYLGLGNGEDVFDFNAAPSQGTLNTSDMDMDFDSPAGEASFFSFSEPTVNPSSIGGQEPASSLPSPPVLQTQNASRVWPGMHQQAALAKARAQREQQEQIILQQQQRRSVVQAQAQQPRQAQRPKGVQPTDPIVEQKITQLLNSMRAKTVSGDDDGETPMPLTRLKKDEEDMDDDERLLASEEGKKLSSKERRQLRNKVSARAFRSRRKEYISQLESEIANKVNENGDLRAHNRALVDENKRLTDLTRMLLSSPSFSDFLDRLSSNPQAAPQPQQQPQQQQQQETSRQVPKDVNAYAAQQHLSQQQINLAIIPEHNMDFSMLSLDTTADAFNYQPQVYAVFETPEPPMIDTALLSGKTSNFVGPQLDSDEKVEMPVIEERPVVPVAEVETKVEAAAPAVVDEEFENDERFSLYHSEPVKPKAAEAVVELDTTGLTQQDIFGGIQTEKALARYELLEVSEEDEAEVALAMARVQRLSANLESVMARLELLTCDL